MLEWLDHLGRLTSWLVSMVRAPLRVEVSQVSLERIRNDGGPLVIITPHPVRYRAGIRITNRVARVVFIREIRFCLGDLSISADALPVKRLDPDDYTDADVIFPVDDGDRAAEAGPFRLTVVPTRGRTARTSGSFPLA
jgi:hypothetical protein